ncbi:uncharacterized protein LOC125585766 [Brassica napus]|uniref:uncharacterized protein LOC125585766 n=1 Tax=Brassica napus TaxID=3708 RepID=UPI00207A9BE4|nr:uncharacterized protein LOC125585766 [Brassica napus]
MQTGSWMWRKLLKLREVAKSFYRKKIGNGRHTSFWFDKWSERGVLVDLLGARGFIDIGIRKEATVEEAILCFRRRRRHRVEILNEIEEELARLKDKLCVEVEDVSQWKRASGFKQVFSTCETWRLIREEKDTCDWASCIWFSQATPKYAFMAWLANLNRLSTMDRIARWSQGVDTTCVLCKNSPEDRNHLFFECAYSSQVWESLNRGIMGTSFTNSWSWSDIVQLIVGRSMEKKLFFCLRYTFQSAIHALWRERNRIRHGEKMLPLIILKKMLDKGVRNKLSQLRSRGVKGMEDTLQVWFGTRG